MHRYRTDREFTVDVQAEYSGIADRTIAEETYDLTQPGMPRAPYPVVASLQTLLDFMARNCPKPEAPTPGNLSTTGSSVSWRTMVLSTRLEVRLNENGAIIRLAIDSFCCGVAVTPAVDAAAANETS